MKHFLYFSIVLFGSSLGLPACAQHGVARGSLSDPPASSLPDSVQHVHSRATSQAVAGTADTVQTSRRIIFTKQAPAPIGPYSQAVVVQGNLVYTAGQIPIVPATGEVVVGDIKVQAKQTLENLKAVLEAAGSGLQHVVKTTVYLVDMREFGAMNEIYSQYFVGSPPARTTVEVARLPKDVRVEIEAVGLVVHK